MKDDTELVAAVRKLVMAKGRFHTAQNYAAVVEALVRYDAAVADDAPEPSQCQWPTCQSEEVQAMLAQQIHRDLYGDAPVPEQVLQDGYQSSTMVSGPPGATITMYYATRAQGEAVHALLCKMIDAGL